MSVCLTGFPEHHRALQIAGPVEVAQRGKAAAVAHQMIEAADNQRVEIEVNNPVAVRKQAGREQP
jgi:hypothetical protein